MNSSINVLEFGYTGRRIRTIDCSGNSPSLESVFPETVFSNVVYYIIRLSERMCHSTGGMYVMDTFILVDLPNHKLRVPRVLETSVAQCSIGQKTVVIPVRLETEFSAHSNLVLVSPVTETIEFFEPHGLLYGLGEPGIDNPGIIERCIHTAFPFTRGYAFVNSANTCPLGLGAQAMQEQSLYATFSEPKGGLCLAWSLYILAVYVLSDPSVTIADCHSFLVTTFGPDELELLVRQFITFATSVPARPTEYAHETVYTI